MRYPDSVEIRYIPLADSHRREFAPFIFFQGRQTNAKLIYLNNQLIYFAGASDLAPFSLHVFTDTADICIRNLGVAYVLKDVIFKKGYKTEISFNPTNLPRSIQKIAHKDTLSKQELAQLNRNISWFEKGWEWEQAYLWQLGKTIMLPQSPNFSWEGKSRYCVGPLSSREIALGVQGKFGRYLKVAPGKSYRVKEDMIHTEDVPGFNKYVLRDYGFSSRQLMGRVALLPHQILLTETREAVHSAKNSIFTFGNEEKGLIHIPSSMGSGTQVFVRQCEDSTNIWPLYRDGIYHLVPGCYDFMFRTGGGQISKREAVQIQKDFILLLKPDWEQNPYVFDTVMNRILSARSEIVVENEQLYSINQALKQGKITLDGVIEGEVENALILLFGKNNKLLLHKKSDSKGEFRATALDTGTYDMIILHPDHQLLWQQVKLKEAWTEVRFNLQKQENEPLREEIQAALCHTQELKMYRVTQDLRTQVDRMAFEMTFVREDVEATVENDFFKPYAYPPRGRKIIWKKWPNDSLSVGIESFKEKELAYEVPWVLSPNFWDIFVENDSLLPIGRMVRGRVLSRSDNQALAGATVVIRDPKTNKIITGVYTDDKGIFQIKVPFERSVIEVNFVSFQPYRKNVVAGGFEEIYLTVDGMLDEVVLTGYGVESSVRSVGGVRSLFKSKRSRQPSRITDVLDGRVRGVVSGGRSKGESLQEMQESVLSNRRPVTFATMDSDGDGVDDYRDKAPRDETGTLIIPPGQVPESFNSLRQDFRDNAYWRPDILTDAQGQARIRVKMPDDITGWRTHVYAMNSKLQVGRKDGMIQSLKQLTARLSLPRFMVEGDSAQLIGRVINYGPKTYLQTSFGLSDEAVSRHDTLIGELLIEQFPLRAEVTPPLMGLALGAPFDTLEARYLLRRQNGYLDGEIREIPVFPKGVLEHTGGFFYLEGDTTVDFAPLAGEGEVELIARNNPLQLLLKDLDYLIRYPHDCNEQMASRLEAMRLAREARQALDLPDDKRQDINAIKRRLHRAQHEDGSWGWWPSSAGSLWMTAYVTHALQQNDGGDPKLEKAFTFLNDSMAVRFGRYERSHMLRILVSMAEMNAPTDYNFFFDRLAIDSIPRTAYEKLLIMRLRQLTGKSYSIDSLFKAKNQTALGGYYWGKTGWRWYGGEIEQSLLAYKILRQHGGQEGTLQRIRAYFFETRNRNGWRNTIESARILGTLVPDLVAASKQSKAEAQLELSYGNQKRLLQNWPVRMVLEDYEGGSIAVRKQGNAPVFVSLFQRRWERQPAAVDSLFEIKTKLTSGGKAVEELVSGQLAVMEVSLVVKKRASYVSLEVPIPAGCSYGEKTRSYGYGREVHREYRKEKVNIYFTHLPVGTYRFQIKLEPRYGGKYTLNPAKAEMMYEPIFFGRNGIGDVRIR